MSKPEEGCAELVIAQQHLPLPGSPRLLLRRTIRPQSFLGLLGFEGNDAYLDPGLISATGSNHRPKYEY